MVNRTTILKVQMIHYIITQRFQKPQTHIARSFQMSFSPIFSLLCILILIKIHSLRKTKFVIGKLNIIALLDTIEIILPSFEPRIITLLYEWIASRFGLY